MRSETSPVIAPLYSPTQARSDCNASRSPCAIAFAVSFGVCGAGGVTGTVATRFGLVPAVDGAVICACAETPATTKNSVAASRDLMTNPGERLDNLIMTYNCLVGNNGAGGSASPTGLRRHATRI